jgi:hypothetical protein
MRKKLNEVLSSQTQIELLFMFVLFVLTICALICEVAQPELFTRLR